MTELTYWGPVYDREALIKVLATLPAGATAKRVGSHWDVYTPADDANREQILARRRDRKLGEVS